MKKKEKITYFMALFGFYSYIQTKVEENKWFNIKNKGFIPGGYISSKVVLFLKSLFKEGIIKEKWYKRI